MAVVLINLLDISSNFSFVSYSRQLSCPERMNSRMQRRLPLLRKDFMIDDRHNEGIKLLLDGPRNFEQEVTESTEGGDQVLVGR
jgi:hypothetical protein